MTPLRSPRTAWAQAAPASRPLRAASRAQLLARFEGALHAADGAAGAHCIHELWMRGDLLLDIDAALDRLWQSAARFVPEWLPMRHIEWLPIAYEVAGRFPAGGRGRTNLYLVLLDYRDSRRGPYGVYVGMSAYAPAERFDQHKAGIRAAGAVLRRGLEVLSGPTLHLQGVRRAVAARIERELAVALAAEGLLVQGGH